jgi:Na+-translocating ferredoxin:NAD+ oxidoreductase RnfE subunit
MILGRAEAHSSKNPPLRALTNALGMGLGFSLGLFALGSVREISVPVRCSASPCSARTSSPGW